MCRRVLWLFVLCLCLLVAAALSTYAYCGQCRNYLCSRKSSLDFCAKVTKRDCKKFIFTMIQFNSILYYVCAKSTTTVIIMVKVKTPFNYKILTIIQFNSVIYYLCAESKATRPITDTV
jgi:hypothetical protein